MNQQIFQYRNLCKQESTFLYFCCNDRKEGQIKVCFAGSGKNNYASIVKVIFDETCNLPAIDHLKLVNYDDYP